MTPIPTSNFTLPSLVNHDSYRERLKNIKEDLQASGNQIYILDEKIRVITQKLSNDLTLSDEESDRCVQERKEKRELLAVFRERLALSKNNEDDLMKEWKASIATEQTSKRENKGLVARLNDRKESTLASIQSLKKKIEESSNETEVRSIRAQLRDLTKKQEELDSEIKARSVYVKSVKQPELVSCSIHVLHKIECLEYQAFMDLRKQSLPIPILETRFEDDSNLLHLIMGGPSKQCRYKVITFSAMFQKGQFFIVAIPSTSGEFYYPLNVMINMETICGKGVEPFGKVFGKTATDDETTLYEF